MQEQNLGFIVVCGAYSVVLVVSKELTSKVTVAIADTKEFLYVWSVTEILRFTKNEYFLFTAVTPLCFIYQPINIVKSMESCFHIHLQIHPYLTHHPELLCPSV